MPDRLAAALKNFGRFIECERKRNARESEAARPKTQTIYHYTDVKGALGILTSARLWLTERAYLNDPSEIKYGVECAVRMAEQIATDSPTKLRCTAAQYLKDGLDAGLRRFGFYVASFSFDRDDLSHWRAYADEGRGVVLGFGSGAFDKDAPGQTVLASPQSFGVRYEKTVLKEYQRRAVGQAMTLLEAPELQECFSRHHRTAVPQIFADLGVLVLFNSLLFKHPAYGHEKEFRVLLLGDRKKIASHWLHRVRERNGEVVGYLDRPIHPALTTPGALTHIRVGPAAPDRLAAQFGETVRSLGIPEPQIDKSDIPFRALR